MELRTLDLKSLFFIVILLFLGLVMFQLFSPFLNIIVVALVLVQLFHPIYKQIHKRIKVSGIASLLTTLITLVFVILPLILISFLAVFEISSVLSNLSVNEAVQTSANYPNYSSSASQNQLGATFTSLEAGINDMLNSLNSSLNSAGIDLKQLLVSANLITDPTDEFLTIDLGNLVGQALVTVQSNIAPALSGLVAGGVGVLFFSFLLIVTILYMFTEYENLPRIISRVSPLDDGLDELLFKKFTETNRAVIVGSFLVAIAQATAVSIALILMGVGAPVLLWLLMVILSLIPVGSGLVWAPVGLALAISGRPVEGILLIAYSAVIINVIDTYLRPRVMKNSVQLHPLVIIFSALGGIAMFGPLGILYGPVIAVFFTSLMDVYVQRYSTKGRNLAAKAAIA